MRQGGSDGNSNSVTNAGGTTEDSHLRNVNKLEEVLKRQRDRLDNIQDQF